MVLTLTVCSTENERACPTCGQLSRNVHSRYQRTLADLPVQGLLLRFRMRVRRFYCRARDCTPYGPERQMLPVQAAAR
jgi:hypothetical protein